MDRDVARGAVFLDWVNQIGWIGNYVRSFAMTGVGIAFDVWSVVLMGLAAGIPGGLVTHCAIVRRLTAFRARSQGRRLGVFAAGLVLAVMLVALGGRLGGVWAASTSVSRLRARWSRKGAEMALRFRSIDVTPQDPVTVWGVEGISTAIERGYLPH